MLNHLVWRRLSVRASGSLRLNVGTHLTLSIGLVIGIASLVLFVSIYRQQEQQITSHLDTQAQALLTEMVGLREWVAAYSGVWTTRPGDFYLDTRNGFYRKSPAMVTKELSTLLNARSDFRFHITSLRLKNPANAPDDFERQILHEFERNAVPVSRIETVNGTRVYRLMIPLKTEPACLDCHADQGYQVGDVRGGLSVLVPTARMDQNLAESRGTLILAAVIITLFVMVVLYGLVQRVVVTPLRQLKAVAVAVGQGNYNVRSTLRTGDELETLGETLNQMIINLQSSRAALQKRMEQRTQELTALSDVALIISHPGALEDVLNEALDTVLRVTGAEGGTIHLADDGTLRLTATRGLTGPWRAALYTLRLRNTLLSQAATLGQAIHIADLAHPNEAGIGLDHDQALLSANYRSLLVAPLRSRNHTLGTLTLVHRQPAGFAPEMIQLLTCIGHLLGVAVENAHFHERTEQMAVLEERARIARELHDSLAQALGFLNLKTDILEGTIKRHEWEQAQAEISEVRRVVREACYDVRESIDGLRTRPSEGTGLIPTLAAYLHEFGQRSGLLTVFNASEGELALAPAAEIEVLRIVQEALMNVRKHAQAKCVQVTIQAQAGLARIEIADDGRGFVYKQQEEPQHFGLRIMRERAERIGGTCQVESAPGQGTRVIVQVRQHDKTPLEDRVPTDQGRDVAKRRSDETDYCTRGG